MTLIAALFMSSGCYASTTVRGDALHAAAQLCRGEVPDAPSELVYTDRKGRVRVADRLNEQGQPAGRTIVIDKTSKSLWEDGWKPVCYGPSTGHVDRIKTRTEDMSGAYMAIGATVAIGAVLMLPVIWLATCGFGC